MQSETSGAPFRSGMPDNDGRHRSRPSLAKLFRVAAGLAHLTPEETAFLNRDNALRAFLDNARAALEERSHPRGTFTSPPPIIPIRPPKPPMLRRKYLKAK